MSIAFFIFVCAALFVLYVLFGYALVLRILPGRKPGKRIPPAEPRSVSVILPVRDGERWIARKLASIFNLEYPREMMQVIVVSDGSNDATEDIVRAHPGVELISIPPSGKAVALNHGIARATGEILFFVDVRQDLDRRSLAMLVDTFDDPEVGVASGELVIRTAANAEETNVGLYWRYEKWIRRRLSNIDSTMGATGAIYAMRRSLAVRLPADTLLDDVYQPLQAFLRGYRVLFVSGALAYDDPIGLHLEFRRKVRTLAGVYQLIAALPQLLGPGNRMWFHFVSYKLARLLLPFGLLALFISSFFLPHPWALILSGGQIAFYALAALDKHINDTFPLKRVSSIVRTFVVLTVAAACAVSIAFLPSDFFWKRPTKSSA
jgi:poly-beta-1,6-N-acetyl-D-glucosamine synthase